MIRSKAVGCLAVAACLGGPTAGASTEQDAEALLRQVLEAYSARDSYADVGEIEIIEEIGGERSSELHFFETIAKRDAGVIWRLMMISDRGPVDRTVWKSADSVMLYEGESDRAHHAPSISRAIQEILGTESALALIVPSLLDSSSGPGTLADVAASASVSGPRLCFGDRNCHLVSAPLERGGEIRLQVEAETLWIHDVEVVVPGELATTTVRVRHSESSLESGDPESLAAFPAPASNAPAAEPADAEAGQLLFSDVVTVDLFTVSARVVDSFARPIATLVPGDLIATVGGRELPIAAVDWRGSLARSSELAVSEPGDLEGLATEGPSEFETEGRLIVIFLQNDFHPSRVKGQMKLFPGLKRLVEGLGPRDRVAVLSYYGHLKFWRDFTVDKAAVRESLGRAFFPGAKPGPVERGKHPSLLDFFDPAEARNIANSVEAMRYTADALAPIPGEKDIVFFGYGLEGGQSPAMLRALQAARATTFVLDTTQADFHTLGATLRTMARATGGTYASSYVFANRELHRIERLLTGHHVITIDRSGLPDARGDLIIRLRNQKGTVLMKPLELR